MRQRFESVAAFAVSAFLGSFVADAQNVPGGSTIRPSERPQDPAAAATATKSVPTDRPEQQLTDHDRADIFDPKKPAPLSPALKGQPKEGRITGFDFARDPLNADKPFLAFEEVMSNESSQRPTIMAAQRKLLESRYNLAQQEKADLVAFLRAL